MGVKTNRIEIKTTTMAVKVGTVRTVGIYTVNQGLNTLLIFVFLNQFDFANNKEKIWEFLVVLSLYLYCNKLFRNMFFKKLFKVLNDIYFTYCFGKSFSKPKTAF